MARIGGSGSCGQEFVNGLAEGKDGHGAPLVVEERLGVVDSEMGVDSGPKVIRGKWPLHRIFSEPIRCADDLSGSHTAACHDE